MASGIQNVSVEHFHCPECKRGMHLKQPMYVKYDDIVASGVQKASVAHSHSPECERGIHLKRCMYVKYNDIEASGARTRAWCISIVQNASVACF